MKPLSNRYAIAASALLLAAFLLATYGGQERRFRDDCARPDALGAPGHFRGAKPYVRDEERESQTTPLWTQGRIRLQLGTRPSPEFEALVIRSFDPINLYLQPDNLSPRPDSADKGRLEWVETEGGKLPVHFLYSQSRNTALWRTAFTMYMFVYDGEPVAHPFGAQLASSFSDIAFGRRPMTVLLVRGAVSNLYLEKAEKVSMGWIVNSWERYQATCFD